MKSHRNVGSYTTLSIRTVTLAVAGLFVLSATATAEILLVADPDAPTDGVRSYTLDGTLVNSSLVSGSAFQGLAISGSTLYAANPATPSVGAYTLDGTGNVSSSNPFFAFGVAPGVTSPYGLVTSAANLFIANFNSGNILKYNFLGTEVNSLSVGLTDPYGLAIYGDTLFVSQATTGAGANTIHGYSLTTFSSTPTITITANLDNPHGLAVSGSTLYIANGGSGLNDGKILTYDLINGGSPTALVSGLGRPQGITVYGSTVYVAGAGDGGSDGGTVSAYNTSTGLAAAGFTKITGLTSPNGIVIAPTTPVPEPATYGAITGMALLALVAMRRRRIA